MVDDPFNGRNNNIISSKGSLVDV